MIAWISANWDNVLAIYGGIVAVCTTIVKMTPSTKDDTIWGSIIKVLDLFSTAFTDSDKKKIEKK